MNFSILNALLTLSILYGTCIPIFGSVYKYGIFRSPVPDNHIHTSPDNWYDNQRVDHFNTSDTRTYKQRYFINDKYYKTGGPVFLLVDGESEASDYFITTGAVSEYAKQFNALLVDLEHRYYGHSVPTEDLSVDNLRYLTVGQALKDTEQFIGYLNKKLALNNNTKWIAFGGSYPGNLVAFLREKYPHAVAGSVASSAPVEARYNNREYFGAVGRAMGAECSKQVREAINQLELQIKTPKSWPTIDRELNLCGPFNGTDRQSVGQLIWSLAIPFATAAQYNGRGNTIGVEQVCALMTTGQDVWTPLQRYAKVIGQFNKGGCLTYDYNELITEIKKSSKTAPGVVVGARQWIYQTCSEFAYFRPTDHPDSPFGHSLNIDYYTTQCVDIFGKQFTRESIQKSVDRFNANYGGSKPNLTNVVFPNGAVDPWHELSVLKDLNNSSRAILMKTTAHGADMDGTRFTDPRELTDARLAIEQQIKLFLQ